MNAEQHTQLPSKRPKSDPGKNTATLPMTSPEMQYIN
jgi:hypothetical protein